MTRTILAALLLVVFAAPAVHGQARLLPPPDSLTAAKTASAPEPQAKARLAILGAPLAASSYETPPPPPQATSQNAQPHQMYGREPAHGTKTAGVPQPSLMPVPVVSPSEAPAISMQETCGPCGRFWAEMDALVWWIQGNRPPALVTTSPTGTPQANAGVLGVTGTTILAGDKEHNDDARAGFRFNIGYWCDPAQTIGIQAGAFWVGNNNSSQSFSSDGSTILARPFIDANSGIQSSMLVAYPGVSSGDVLVSSHTSLSGWDVALRQNACCCCNCRIDAILGYRQLRLSDQLEITQNSTSLGGTVPAGTLVSSIDRFGTTNEFYGAELGVVGEYRHCGWVVEGLAKMLVGWNSSRVNINGLTTTTLPGQSAATVPGGFLALSSNIGSFRNGDATLIPELGVNLAYDLSCHLRLRGGYSFLFWSQLDRPGQQIDTTVNPNLLPGGAGGGPTRPQQIHEETDMFVHGINFGFEVRY